MLFTFLPSTVTSERFNFKIVLTQKISFHLHIYSPNQVSIITLENTCKNLLAIPVFSMWVLYSIILRLFESSFLEESLIIVVKVGLCYLL